VVDAFVETRAMPSRAQRLKYGQQASERRSHTLDSDPNLSPRLSRKPRIDSPWRVTLDTHSRRFAKVCRTDAILARQAWYHLIVTFLAATWQRGIAAPAYKQDELEFYIDDLGSADDCRVLLGRQGGGIGP